MTSSADGSRNVPVFAGPERKSMSTRPTRPPPNSRWAYALGSCLYSGGLSIIDLTHARTHIAHRAGLRSARAVCGERIAAGKNYAVAIGSETAQVFDAKNGRVVRRIALTAAPLDVVVR